VCNLSEKRKKRSVELRANFSLSRACATFEPLRGCGSATPSESAWEVANEAFWRGRASWRPSLDIENRRLTAFAAAASALPRAFLPVGPGHLWDDPEAFFYEPPCLS